MMTTAGVPPRSGYQGRVRGLRQGGGGRMKVKKAPAIGSGDRFKNLVGQLSKRPGSLDSKRMAAFGGIKRKKK